MGSRLQSKDSHAAPGEYHGQADCPPAAHREAHVTVGAYSLKEIAAHKEDMLELDYPKARGKDPAWSRGKVYRKKKHQRSCYGLTTALIPHSVPLRGKRQRSREIGSEGEKLSLGRKTER